MVCCAARNCLLEICSVSRLTGLAGKRLVRVNVNLAALCDGEAASQATPNRPQNAAPQTPQQRRGSGCKPRILPHCHPRELGLRNTLQNNTTKQRKVVDWGGGGPRRLEQKGLPRTRYGPCLYHQQLRCDLERDYAPDAAKACPDISTRRPKPPAHHPFCALGCVRCLYDLSTPRRKDPARV